MLKRFISTAVIAMSVASSAFAVESGAKAPAFSLPALQNLEAGSTLSLSDYKGKVVYVDFWASWCGPCRQSLPILNDVRAKHASKGFEVIAVNVDENTMDAVDFLVKHPVDYPIVSDPEAKTPEAYNLKGMPTAYLIDKNGVVRHVHEGGVNKKGAQKLEKMIAQYLAE